MSDEADLLSANRAFYDAFAARDVAAMDALWARERAVACIHPGWPALLDRAAVVDSWRRILAAPGAPTIRCTGERAYLMGEAGFVICYEVLDDARLVATNYFAREGGAWRLIHHQAGPTPGLATPERPATGPARRLH